MILFTQIIHTQKITHFNLTVQYVRVQGCGTAAGTQELASREQARRVTDRTGGGPGAVMRLFFFLHFIVIVD